MNTDRDDLEGSDADHSNDILVAVALNFPILPSGWKPFRVPPSSFSPEIHQSLDQPDPTGADRLRLKFNTSNRELIDLTQ